MVPSVGFMTALYASFFPSSNAWAMASVSASRLPFTDLEKPRKKRASIAPELPLAERSTASAALVAHSETLSFSGSISRTAPRVRLMLVPVSPSGTGNTLRLLISVLLFSSVFAAETSMAYSVFPPTVIFAVIQTPSHLA